MPVMDEDDDEGPPPLDPATEGTLSTSTHHRREAFRRRGGGGAEALEAAPSEPLRHGMGGGDVVLILDLPEVSTVGYDAISFTAKHFGGVRDVPPGPHFFWVAHDPHGLATRSGCWVVGSGHDRVHALRWDRFTEVLGEATPSDDGVRPGDVDPIHAKLAPFRDPGAVNAQAGRVASSNAERSMQMWAQLTGNITADLLTRVTGIRADVWPVHTADHVKDARRLASEVELDRRLPSSTLQTRELEFAFSQTTKTYSTAHTGANRTHEATDATPYIESLLDSTGRGLTEEDIVGEFQLAYVVGMHLGNDSCIQQWWHMLLHLVLKAYDLPARRPALAEALLRALAAQLTHSTDWLDESVLDYSDAQARDLRLALTVYKRRLDDLLPGDDAAAAGAPPRQLAVGAALARVEGAVAAGPGWDLRGEYVRRGTVMTEEGERVEVEMADLQAEDERGEWAPEVVELDEGGRERGLVSWTD